MWFLQLTCASTATDFGIHGLWPVNKDGSFPSNCDPYNYFDESQIGRDVQRRLKAEWPTFRCPSNDGTRFWTHEWTKHGTCCETYLKQQHQYFQAALDLKHKTNLLQALRAEGVKPNGRFYDLEDIKQAIRKRTGFEPWIKCNRDAEDNVQLYEVYMCVDTSGKTLIKCPVFPTDTCASSRVQFPAF